MCDVKKSSTHRRALIWCYGVLYQTKKPYDDPGRNKSMHISEMVFPKKKVNVREVIKHLTDD